MSADLADIRDRLREYLRGEILHRKDSPLADDEPLMTGGLMDSYALARVAVFIEGAFGCRIPDTDLTVEAMDTVERMARRVARELA